MINLQNVSVAVNSRFLPEQSHPELERYVFAYTVTIFNKSKRRLQILSREWRITTGDGHTQEIQGAGIVGERPLINQNAMHIFNSSTILNTCVGSMQGTIHLKNDDGETFTLDIPIFRLAMPGAIH